MTAPGVEAGPEPAPSGSRPLGRLPVAVGVFGLYLVGGVVAYWHVWAHPTGYQLQSGAGDPAQYDWFFRWTPWAVAHGVDPFVSHIVNVPFGVNLVDNTAMFALGLVMAPVTVIWGPVATVNVLFTLAMPLSASAGYLLARRFVAWRPAAFAAGAFYGYSPYMVGQGLGHINLVFVPLPPLIFLTLHELLVRQRGSARRWGGLLGALVVVQFLISSEVLATTALFAAVTVVVLALCDRSSVADRLRRAAPGLGVAAVTAVVVLVFPLYEVFAGPQHLHGAVGGYRAYHADLVGALFPTQLIRFATAHMKATGLALGTNSSENGTYLGAPLVVLVILAAILVRRRVVRLAALLAAIAYLLSLGVRFEFGTSRFASVARGLPLPGAVLYKLPLINQAFPIRYALFTALFVSVVLACALEQVRFGAPAGRHSGRRSPAGRPDRWRRRALAGAVAVVVLVPLVPAWPYPDEGPVNVPSYFTTAAVDRLAPGVVTLVYPYPMNTDIAPELWQAESGMRFDMVGGYFLVPSPSGPQFFTPDLVEQTLVAMLAGHPPVRTAALRAGLASELRSFDVKAIVAQPVGADPIGFFTWLTGRAPDTATGGMIEWYGLTWR